MKKVLLIFFILTAFLLEKPVLSADLAEEASSQQIPQAQEPDFIPLDAGVGFFDYRNLLPWRADDFDKLFPILINEDSFKEVNETTALSDHDITWGEIAEFATSIGITTWEELQLYLGSRQRAHDYFLYQEATRKLLAKPGMEHVPAWLPRQTLEYYTNWRELRYWLYRYLQAYKVAAPQNLEADVPGSLTDYLKSQTLFPAVDGLHSTDYLEEILIQSVSMGMWLETTSHENTYRLTTAEEMKVWPLSNSTPSQMATEENEGYGRLAVNTMEMRSQPGFEEQERQLQEEKKDHCQFLRASNQQAMKAEHQSHEQTMATLSPALKVMGGVMMVGGTLLQIPWDLVESVLGGCALGAKAIGKFYWDFYRDLLIGATRNIEEHEIPELAEVEEVPEAFPELEVAEVERDEEYEALRASYLFRSREDINVDPRLIVDEIRNMPLPRGGEQNSDGFWSYQIEAMKHWLTPSNYNNNESLIMTLPPQSLVENFERYQVDFSYEGRERYWYTDRGLSWLRASAQQEGNTVSSVERYYGAENNQRFFPLFAPANPIFNESVSNINSGLLYNDVDSYEVFRDAWDNMKRRLQQQELARQRDTFLKRKSKIGFGLGYLGGLLYMLGDQLGTTN